MATYTPILNLYMPDGTDDFGEFREEHNDNMVKIENAISGGGGSGGHTIVDPDGNSLPQEDELQFTGAVSVTDDNVNGRTVVNVSGGSNLILDAQIYTAEEKQVGVWTNRKPLYKKTWELTVPNASGAYYFNEPTPNLEDVVHTEYTLWGLGERGDVPWYNPATILFSEQTDTGIEFYFASNNYAGNKIYYTSYYTKTTDTAGSGGYEAYGFSPVIYSDVERVIGVWRDNKPLYQKTYHFNSLVTLNSNTWFDTGFKISDSVIVGNSVAFRDDNIVGQSFPVIASADIGTNQAIELLQTRNSSITISGFTIQYTKTTDVAGSGDYNTYGVPTVHYSTSEQVIGTWITGKPLYERTFSLGALPNNAIKTVAHGIANVDLIFIADSFFQTGAGVSSYLNFTNDSTAGQIEIIVDRTNFEIWAGSDRTSWNGYATVRYTKSTD